jgi:hypothetical protein
VLERREFIVLVGGARRAFMTLLGGAAVWPLAARVA